VYYIPDAYKNENGDISLVLFEPKVDYEDDVPEEEKTRRLTEVIALQNELSLESNRKDVGKVFEVLVEGKSKRSDEQLCGRTSQNKMVVFDRIDGVKTGDYVEVEITRCSSATLFGKAL
jgi:tRNA-2-methylthio-N6-dimethylallyladenosine synthase